MGTKEGFDTTRNEIQRISDERVKLALERLPVPKVFHPFICGPNNQIIKQLMEETLAKINVPPPSADKDEIIVSGEEEGVMKAKAKIMKIYEEKKRKCVTVSVEVRKSQHKYVIGPRGIGIQEILGATGVSVEVPAVESNSKTITLRGELDHLRPALAMVYSKANSVVFSEVSAPTWLHKNVIGQKGINIRKIAEQYPKVHIEFADEEDKIVVEGPSEEVKQFVKALDDTVKDFQSRTAFTEVTIDQKFHKHIIGRNGQNISRIKSDTGVAINIPSDDVHSNIIRIEGDPEGVETAKLELLEMSKRMENDMSRGILIEQRFHRAILGAGGSGIKDIRDRFNQVQITSPDPDKKSDFVTRREPNNYVDKCHRHLMQLQQEMIASSHRVHVHICKDFHKNIIGKGGQNIRKIREQTNTKIDVPSENNDSDLIVITGKKADVDLAKEKIESIQKELEEMIKYDRRVHPLIIGRKGRNIKRSMDQFKDDIRLPRKDDDPGMVKIIGAEENAEDWEGQLLNIEEEFEEMTKNDRRVHPRIIGRKGQSIKSSLDQFKDDIRLPRKDNDPGMVKILCSEENAEDGEDQLLNLEEEFHNGVIDQGQLRLLTSPPSRCQDSQDSRSAGRGYVVKDAPWDSAPDITNVEEFPSLGTGTASMASHAWGPHPGKCWNLSL